MGQCNRHHQSTHGCKTINQRLQNCLLETNDKAKSANSTQKILKQEVLQSNTLKLISAKAPMIPKHKNKFKKPKLLTISQCQKTNLQHKKQTGIFLGHRIQDPQRFRTAPLRILPCSKASLPPSQCCHQGSLSSSSVANLKALPLLDHALQALLALGLSYSAMLICRGQACNLIRMAASRSFILTESPRSGIQS